MTVEALSYAIDDQDRLIKVDEGYYLFAEENGWDGAGASLGRSLWDFVAGHDVKRLQRLLLRRVREGIRDIELPFRFDPNVARDDGDFLPMCAWCDRFLVGGDWVEVEEAAKRLELFRRSEMPTLDHGICPRCSGTLMAA